MLKRLILLFVIGLLVLGGNLLAQVHFTPVEPTGAPYAIIIQNATINGVGIQNGDEIGVFDGELCVGAGVFTGTYPLPVTAWRGDPAYELPGYTIGHPILYYIWDASAEQEVEAVAEYLNGNGDGTFGYGPFAEVNLTTGAPPQIPDINVTPAQLAFGDVTIGNTPNRTLTISNTGNADLTVTSAVVTGAGFTAPAFNNVTITPGNNATLTVTFAPTAVQNYTGTVTINSNDPDEGVVTVPLSGNGVEQEHPDIDVTPMELDFGTVIIGNTSDLDLIIANVGDLDLTVTSATVVGAGFTAPAFNNVVISPGDDATLTITFTPTEELDYNGSVTINSDDPDEPVVTVTLIGTGREPQGAHFTPVEPTGQPYAIVVDNATIDGEVLEAGDEIGFYDEDLCVGAGTVTGEWPLPLTAWRGDPAYQLPGYTIGHTILHYIWDVSAQMEYEAEAEYIIGNGTYGFGPYAEVILTVTLAGEPDIQITPTELAFGDVFVGDTRNLDLTIANIGNADLLIISAVVAGDGFTAPPFDNLTLTPETTTPLTVTFAPTAGQWYTGTVTITSDDPDTPVVLVDLTGNGIEQEEPDIDVTPGALDFGQVVINTTATLDLNIANTGDADLTVISAVVQGNGFTAPIFNNVLIEPDEAEILPVIFTPTVEQDYNGTVTITSDDPDEGIIVITLSGSGVAVQPDRANVSGTVTDSQTHAGILGALVIYEGYPAQTTNEVGFYQLLNLNPRDYIVIVTAVGYQDYWETVTLNIGDNVVNFELTRTPVNVSGFVYDAITADPIEGASLTFGDLDPVFTNATGYYSLLNIPAGEYLVIITAEGYHEDQETINLTPGDNLYDFPLDPILATASGTVTDATTNDPIDRASVEFEGYAPVETNANGDYLIAGLRPGDYDVTISAAGYVTGHEQVTLVQGDNFNIDFQLTLLAEMQDIDVSPHNLNFGSVLINHTETQMIVIVNQGAQPLTLNSVTLEGDPEFTAVPLTDVVLQPNERRTFSVTFAPLAVRTYNGLIRILSDDPDEGNITVNMVGAGIESAEVTGIVTNARTGDPIALAVVTFEGYDPETTNELGAYIIIDMMPGSYEVTVTAVGFVDYVQQVVLHSGLNENVNFALTPIMGNVTGTVTGEDTGLPIEGASVRFGDEEPVLTDEDGIYLVEDLLPGNYMVTVSADDYVDHVEAVTVVFGDNTFDFVLSRETGTISGTVIRAGTGTAIAGLSVFLTIPGEVDPLETTTNIDGIYSFADLLPGTGFQLDFILDLAYWPETVADVVVTGGQTTTVDVTMTYPDAGVSQTDLMINVYIDTGLGSESVDLIASDYGIVEWNASIADVDWDWITLTPESDILFPGEQETITINIDITEAGLDVHDGDEMTTELLFTGPHWVQPPTVNLTIHFAAVAVREVSGEMPIAYALHQNFPNPFNPVTSIRFDLVEPQFITLAVYNTMGQEIAHLVDDYLPSGFHVVTFEPENLPSGIYFYVIKTEGFSATKKMVMIK